MIRRFHVYLLAIAIVLTIIVSCTSTTPTVSDPPTPEPTRTQTPTQTPTLTPSPVDPYLEGMKLLKQSDFDGAIASFQQALDINPSFAQAYAGLSRTHLIIDINTIKALEFAEKAVEYGPEIAESHISLARALQAAVDPEKALAAAKKAVEIEPENAEAHAVLGQAYLQQLEYEKAFEALEIAYKTNPESADVLCAIGNYHRSTADYGRAEQAIDQAIAIEPQFIGWQIQLGSLLVTSEKFQQADKVYDKVLELSPDHVPTLLSLAFSKVDQKEFASAETLIDQAESIVGEVAPILDSRAYLMIGLEQYDEAIDLLNSSLILEPDSYWTKSVTAQTHLQLDECDQAEDIYIELSELFPPFSEPDAGRGMAELCSGDYKKAISQLQIAVEKDPYDYFPHLATGWVYMLQERWEDAMEALIRSIIVSPAPAAVHTVLGELLFQQDQDEEGFEELQLSKNLNPFYIQNYITMAQLYLAEDQYQSAMDTIQQALDVNEENHDSQRMLGIINYFDGNSQEAREIFENLVEEDPEDEVSHHYLGLSYRNIGLYQDAAREIRTYRSLTKGNLDEDEEFNIEKILAALDEGWILSEEDAIQIMEEFAALFFERSPVILIEERDDQGRTMVVKIRTTQDEIEEGILEIETIIAYSMISYFLPRIDPQVENGADIQAIQGGRLIMSAESSLKDITNVHDGLVSPEEGLFAQKYSAGESGLRPADIEQIKCNVVELRGLEELKKVPGETLSTDEVSTDISESIDEQVRESMARDVRVLRLLGLVAPDLDLEDVWVELFSEQVAGFYSPDEETFYIVESNLTSAYDELVIAHEYTHALQDQHFDLSRLNDQFQNDDQELAFEALIEGDATLTMMVYGFENIAQADLFEVVEEASGIDQDAAAETPNFIRELTLFPYEAGLDFVLSSYEIYENWVNIDKMFGDPPQSTEQILHPEKYKYGEKPVEITQTDLDLSLGDNYLVVDTNVLGEFGIREYLSEFIGPAAASTAAEGWGGDLYTLIESDQDSDSLILFTIWDDQDEADQFWSTFRSTMAHRLGYREIVETMIGEPQYRCWQGDLDTVCGFQEKKQVTIVIGQNNEDVIYINSSLVPDSGNE